MCGIFGYILEERNQDFHEQLEADLANSLKHRGPDDHGVYRHKGACIANTRLSIIDIDGGHQPVFSNDGNVVLVQNGEIYNYIEIREELLALGHNFKTESDTEVLLESYLEWGEKFIEKINGMFAIAILDKSKNILLLYRDRLGVKPLYLYQDGSSFLFSSEIKSFLQYKEFIDEINKQAICDYLVLNYIPLPSTIFRKVKHILPGSYMLLDINDSKNNQTIQYWDVDTIEEDNNKSIEDFSSEIERLFEDAVSIRLRSDVEVGAFLSGGLDSSLVTAFMRKLRPTDNISTYSIGFREKEFDESTYALNVAEKYALKNKMKFLEGDIIEYWNHVTYFNDQPHGDISFIPTFILSEFAAQDLKVVLTGDGGDELFAGYLKYLELEKHGDLSKYFTNSAVFTEEQLQNLLSPGFQSEILLSNAEQIFFDTISAVEHKDLINSVLYYEMKQLLPGNNLVKPDKMAMANSLETRSPFLDYRLFELSNTIPGEMKLKDGDTKHILKKIGIKYFDHEHVYRRKQMFTVPVGEWFKNKLSGYLLDIIESESLKSRGIWNAVVLKNMADDHVSGKANYTRQLRAVVNLELWCRIFLDGLDFGVSKHKTKNA